MSAPYGAAAWLELAETKTPAQLVAMTGLSRRAVYERNRRVGVGPKSTGRARIPLPEGYAEAELGVTKVQLAQRYGVSISTIRIWSIQAQEVTGKTAQERWYDRQKATFLEKYTGEHFYIAAQKLHIAVATVAKWAVEAGVASPKALRMRELALQTSMRKALNRNAAPPSRASWFETVDCPLPRSLYEQAVRPWCPAWEDECEEQPA